MTFAIAHRGLSASHRENSLAAIEAALAHVPVVEVDVRCTRDGVAVCTHDGSLERAYGVPGMVGQLDLAALRAAAPDIATLEQVLDVKVTRPRAIAAIEDAVGRSRIAWNDGRQLRRGEPIDPRSATFQSADAQLLQLVRSRTGAGCVELVRGDSTARELVLGAPLITTYAQGVTIPDLLATRGMLRVLRGLRLGSYVYTVNVQDRYDTLELAGASGVYTDAVDRIGSSG